jgi:hypothetical protein
MPWKIPSGQPGLSWAGRFGLEGYALLLTAVFLDAVPFTSVLPEAVDRQWLLLNPPKPRHQD